MAPRSPSRIPRSPSRREELLRGAPEIGEGAHPVFYSLVLALLVFLFLLSVSFYQLTRPAHARGIIREGIAVLTDVDLVVAEHHDALRALAESSTEPSFLVPGYPLDVRLTRDDVLRTSDTELRDLILERSAALVYEDGLGAFDREGTQALRTFSREGAFESLIGLVSETTHDRARWAALVLGLLTALVAVALAVRNHGYARVARLGYAVAGGSIPGIIIFIAAGALTGAAWGGDDFSDKVADVLRSILEVPLRNYFAGTALGVFLAAAGLLLSFIARRLDPGPSAEDTYFIGAYDFDDYNYSSQADDPGPDIIGQ